MDVDSARMTLSADALMQSSQLAGPGRYAHGYEYPALIAFTSLLSGISVQWLQLNSSFWLVVIVLTAFITYREILASPLAGMLAALLLLLQPDFLFYVLRPSHEKLTWEFALLLIFLLIRSSRKHADLRQLAVTVILFYFLFWGMITSNVYFASTFALALLIGVIGGRSFNILRNRGKSGDPHQMFFMRRQALVVVACLILVYVFINYAYPPALTAYRLVGDMLDRLTLLFLGGQPVEAPASYGALESGWVSQPLYLALTGFQWLIVFLGICSWFAEIRSLSWARSIAGCFGGFSAFSVLLALGMLMDFRAICKRTQLRMFTPFLLLSCPMAALLLSRTLQKLRGSPEYFGGAAGRFGAVGGQL
jgi:hypothetical protein